MVEMNAVAAASAAAAAASCLGLGHDSSGRSTPGRSLRHMLMMTAIAAIAKIAVAYRFKS